MKKILPLIIMILFVTSVGCEQNETSPQFDKIKFEEILPSGWAIKDINNNDYPYGFLRDENDRNGLSIHLEGPTDVKDKGYLITKENVSIWIMPLNYSAKRVPELGTPHFPAKSIGRNENSMIFVLPWNDTPSWKNHEIDLIKYFKINLDTYHHQPLQLTIKSDKGVYRVGEEIWITGYLYNNLEKQIKFLGAQNLLVNALITLDFKIIKSGKDEFDIRPASFSENKYITIEPQSSVEYFKFRLQDFTYVNPAYSIVRPITEILTDGKYLISASIHSVYQALPEIADYIRISNTIQIEVVGKKDKRAKLQPIKSNLVPKKGRVYHISSTWLYKTNEPGPSERDTSIAWGLANEFVFRTELRDYYVLPSQSVTPQKLGGEYVVDFLPKKGDAQLIIRVNINKDEAVIVNARVKERFWTE